MFQFIDLGQVRRVNKEQACCRTRKRGSQHQQTQQYASHKLAPRHLGGRSVLLEKRVHGDDIRISARKSLVAITRRSASVVGRWSSANRRRTHCRTTGASQTTNGKGPTLVGPSSRESSRLQPLRSAVCKVRKLTSAAKVQWTAALLARLKPCPALLGFERAVRNVTVPGPVLPHLAHSGCRQRCPVVRTGSATRNLHRVTFRSPRKNCAPKARSSILLATGD